MSTLRIVVLGYVIRWPLGGMVWSNLHYLMGLAALGHDILYVEESGDEPLCYDPERFVTDRDATYGLRFGQDAFSRIGLGDDWAYYDAHRSAWAGPRAKDAEDFCLSANVVLNLAGRNRLLPCMTEIPDRVFVDEDPSFTQVRHLTEAPALELAEQHNRFFSFGENIGLPGCSVPDDGISWRPTRQPVVLDAIAVRPPKPDGAFTSVLNFESYAGRRYDGTLYGLKAQSMEPFVALPRQTSARLELAAGGSDELRKRLRKHGWGVINPLPPTRDPWTYENYIADSKAEFGIAKHGYVASRSGWFSERSVAYLATGRPVLHQDTGFGRWLDAEAGVLPFSNCDEAAEALDEVASRYELHCAAAREVAAHYFDHRKILPQLLEDVTSTTPGNTPPTSFSTDQGA